MDISNRGEEAGKIDESSCLRNLYMKTDVMAFIMSKNFTLFNNFKIGLVKDKKVIMRIARFCSLNKGFKFTVLMFTLILSQPSLPSSALI